MLKNKYRGFDWVLEYRPSETEWPDPFRLRILPKDAEFKDFKITVYGKTEKAAHYNAYKAMRKVIAENASRKADNEA